MKRKGVVLDIDGVLQLQGKALPGAREAILALKAAGLPIVLLTNNFSPTQEHKAEQLNQTLGQSLFVGSQTIINTTPVWPVIAALDQGVILYGFRSGQKIVGHLKTKRYLTFQELGHCYPQLRGFKPATLSEAETKAKVCQRLGLANLPHNPRQLGIKAIVVINTPLTWQLVLNTTMTLLSQLQPDRSLRWISQEQSGLKIIFTANQLTDTLSNGSKYLVMGSLARMLKDVYKSQSGRELVIESYGKPSLLAMNFARDKLGSEVDQIYMVGDNPETDILGANRAGWKSVLVRTGAYWGQEVAPQSQPSVIVDDIGKAIEFILSD